MERWKGRPRPHGRVVLRLLDGADAEHERRDTGQLKLREVFAGHLRGRVLCSRAKFAYQHCRHAPGQSRVVYQRLGWRSTFDQWLARSARRLCLRLYNATDGTQEMLPHGIRERADSEL